jgi:hypothetical protein
MQRTVNRHVGPIHGSRKCHFCLRTPQGRRTGHIAVSVPTFIRKGYVEAVIPERRLCCCGAIVLK